MRRALAFALLSTVAVLAGLYVYFRPQPAATPIGVANAGAPNRMEFALIVADGKLVSGPALIRVSQGAEVTIRIRSDRADELHLHGYDLHARIDAGQPAELKFTADRSGRFGYELHASHRELGALEVQPR